VLLVDGGQAGTPNWPVLGETPLSGCATCWARPERPIAANLVTLFRLPGEGCSFALTAARLQPSPADAAFVIQAVKRSPPWFPFNIPLSGCGLSGRLEKLQEASARRSSWLSPSTPTLFSSTKRQRAVSLRNADSASPASLACSAKPRHEGLWTLRLRLSSGRPTLRRLRKIFTASGTGGSTRLANVSQSIFS
jgi:hypothetical protein